LIPGTIVGLNNRLFEGSPGFGPAVVPNVTFILSITDAEPGNLSNTFDDNTGPDPVTIFFGDITVGPSEGCNTNPCPFVGEPLPFQIPFQYNPSLGNLLLEIIVPPCVGGTPPDVLIDSTFELSAVFADDSSAVEGQSGFGNIYQLTYLESTPVPTLSEWGLITMAGILGIIGFFAARRRKAAA